MCSDVFVDLNPNPREHHVKTCRLNTLSLHDVHVMKSAADSQKENMCVLSKKHWSDHKSWNIFNYMHNMLKKPTN